MLMASFFSFSSSNGILHCCTHAVYIVCRVKYLGKGVIQSMSVPLYATYLESRYSNGEKNAWHFSVWMKLRWVSKARVVHEHYSN